MRKQMLICDHCGKVDDEGDQSRYERAANHTRIFILIPPSIVTTKHKEGITDNHAHTIEGDFCSLQCLLAKIDEVVPYDWYSPCRQITEKVFKKKTKNKH